LEKTRELNWKEERRFEIKGGRERKKEIRRKRRVKCGKLCLSLN
jgi:hypothetical protein